MVRISLGGKIAAGRSALVDDDMAGALMEWRWHCDKHGYARRCVYYGRQDGKPKNRFVYMHAEVWRLAGKLIPAGQELDHSNGDKLDNRLSNLRPATRGQNQHNQKPRKGGASRNKGVYWHKRSGKWRAYITHNGKRIHLGYFTNEPDAGKAYDTAARRLFGEYARCNFP